MTTAAESAGDFLVTLSDQLGVDCVPQSLRTVLSVACGGRLDTRGPDGRRSSELSRSGIPFEVSVTGGRGRYAPAIRYVTETTTWRTAFADRLHAYLAAIAELAARLPPGNESTTDLLHAFVTALLPDPVATDPYCMPTMWLGIVHHPAEPNHPAVLKVYCAPDAQTDPIEAVGRRWPVFRELSPVPADEEHIHCAGIAMEVDAGGHVKHKIYLRAASRNVAVPMKLVRYFGEAAWEVLDELVRCGIDAASLHEFSYYICCTHREDGTRCFTVTLMLGSSCEYPELIRELASRHHGTTRAVDAMTHAAAACNASWHNSGLALGFSPGDGIDKFTVYGAPTWEDLGGPAASDPARQPSQ
ncbi:hypothetical protein [Nocardia nova]|uniref:hypothetical protein n=1 Tax=Nocardia nova TaxID=37330 RepID=UPI0033FEC672